MNDLRISQLSFLGALFTLIVISLGAWVRLTDAGLGCPDWPGCYGLLTTPDTPDELAKAKEYYPDAVIDVGKAWREMLHRYMAGILGLYVFFYHLHFNKIFKKKLYTSSIDLASDYSSSHYGNVNCYYVGKANYSHYAPIFWNVNCNIIIY